MSTSDTSGPRAGRCVTAHEFDLEDLAAAYRHRPATAQALIRAKAEVVPERVPSGGWAIDVGGGTGAHASAWLEAGVHAVVLDPSPSMRAAAARRSGVAAVGGIAQAMPFRASVFDLVYFHLSIHYGDWRRALDEAIRVVRPGGRISIWTLGPAHHRSSFLAQWFPRVAEIDEGRFPDPEALAAHLGAAGCEVMTDQVVETVRRSAASWVAAVEHRFVSTIQLLDDRELENGLSAFRSAVPDPDATVEYRLVYDHLDATR